MGISRVAVFGALLLSVVGCVPPYVIPEPLDRQVDRQLSLTRLRQDPELYKGATVVLGGVVLGAKIVQEGTEIEVLQLPLDGADRPTGAYEYSEGRFLLLDPERRDPAVLQHRLVTAVGEVLGAKILKVDEFEYPVPFLSARFVQVWQGAGSYPGDTGYPYSYPYSYPYAYPYYYPYAPYYPYFYVNPFFWGPTFHYPGPPAGPAVRRFAPPMGGGPPVSPPRPSTPGPGAPGRRFN